jgi:hypothetical protein
MKSTAPAVFRVSHRLAERAAETWVQHATVLPMPRWRKRPSMVPWKKGDWALCRRAFDAGARWMLKPFQQVCGLDRGPSGTQYQKAWKQVRARITSEDATLKESLAQAWHSGRVFLELWIQNERFPL